jgi:acyl-CoA reductase-like NAD-dependent aldehyde dehydrogenase
MSATITSALPIAERVQRARVAQRAWEATRIRQRLRCVRALRHFFATDCDAICAAVARDLGKTTEETIGGDLLPAADACRFLEHDAARLLRQRSVPRSRRPLWLWGQSDVIHRRPRGVVGIIGTWNYPVFLNAGQIAQALTAGNAVVWKPSEVAQSVAAMLQALFDRAGYPADLLQVLPATREAGAELAEADVDHIVFTGSADVGRRLAARLGERLISSTLELSGCDAQYVLEDADVALAARAAWFGATVNRGQTCIAVRRAFVVRPMYSAFCDALKVHAEAATPCRLALESQVRLAERLVREAVADGGRLLGAPRPNDPPLRSDEWRPAVVVDARGDMALCREASFAPLLAVVPVDSVEQALEMDARCPYRLGASVFTAQPARAAAIAERVRTGMVTVNDTVAPTAHPATPFGGRGESGWGSTQGAEGLLEMTVPQVVSVRGGSYRPHYDLTTAGAASQEGLLRGLLECGHSPTLWGRWRGWRRLLGALWRGR